MITYDDFAKLELKVAKVISAERVEKSEKLIKMQLDAGDKNETGEPIIRQILGGIGKQYDPEVLVGKEIIIVANLEPRALMGETSNGMLLAASDMEGIISLLLPDKDIQPGSKVK